MLMAFLVGWAEARWQVTPPEGTTMSGISVVIAFRNEEANLTNLINDLSNLTYVKESFEVILVNDHSTDGSFEIATRAIMNFRNFRVLDLPQDKTGKKLALDFGIREARFDIIATTDADCRYDEQWLWHISTYFERGETHMLVGPVMLRPDDSLFSRLQAIEFSSLMGSAAAAIGLGHPIMCNGANLSFRKRSFLEVDGYQNNLAIPSGDDEFLMRKMMARYPDCIRFLNIQEAIVSSQTQPTWKGFFFQRIRWAGKWKHNPDALTKTVAAFVLIAHLAYVGLWTAFILAPDMVIIFLAIKIILEGVFLAGVARFLRQPVDPASFILWQILYPFYVVVIGLLSLPSSYRWKDRNYK